jgi:hypothetical protein
MKKLIVSVILVMSFLALPARSLAAETNEIICPQPYGGAVVCGVHTPVNTGIADNLGIIVVGITLGSGVLFRFSKKFKNLGI